MSTKIIYGIQNIFSLSSRERCMTNLKKLNIPKYGSGPAATAAVLVPLCRVGDVPSMMYTVKTTQLNMGTADCGKITFPGGRTIGESSVPTALRETIEEIGLSPKRITVWGEAPPVPGQKNKLMITPVLGSIMDLTEQDFTVNTDEIAEVFTVPIEMLCDPRNQFYTQFKNSSIMPVFTVDEYKIQGVTAYITHGVLSSLLSKDVYNNEWMKKRIQIY